MVALRQASLGNYLTGVNGSALTMINPRIILYLAYIISMITIQARCFSCYSLTQKLWLISNKNGKRLAANGLRMEN